MGKKMTGFVDLVVAGNLSGVKDRLETMVVQAIQNRISESAKTITTQISKR